MSALEDRLRDAIRSAAETVPPHAAETVERAVRQRIGRAKAPRPGHGRAVAPIAAAAAITAIRSRIPVVASLAILGMAGGITATAVNPPMYSSRATVLISPQVKAPSTLLSIAGSNQVLEKALKLLHSHMPMNTLRQRVTTEMAEVGVVGVTAQGMSPVEAEHTANAVADAYVAFLTSGVRPGHPVPAEVLNPATAAHTSALAVGAVTGCIGLVSGLLLGCILALVITKFRSPRRPPPLTPQRRIPSRHTTGPLSVQDRSG
jgi:capsular polysaccharide biosynthesis protein